MAFSTDGPTALETHEIFPRNRLAPYGSTTLLLIVFVPLRKRSKRQ